VSYPVWARLQEHPQARASSVESTLKWICRLSLPAFAVLAGLAPQIIEHVYGAKWQPALPSLYLLCANMTLEVGTSILIPALYSCGRAKTALRTAAGWAVLTWLLALALVAAGVGLEALPLAATLGTAVAVAVVLFEVRDMGLDLRRTLALPLLTGLASVMILALLGPVAVHGIPSLIALAVIIGTAALLANVWSERLVATSAFWAALK
jgi:O-antigen/teichoic acid export membrane protein